MEWRFVTWLHTSFYNVISLNITPLKLFFYLLLIKAIYIHVIE